MRRDRLARARFRAYPSAMTSANPDRDEFVVGVLSHRASQNVSIPITMGADMRMQDRSGYTIWFTGLSGAGKTTLAMGLGAALIESGRRVEILDGDEVR